ncbi:hypothetical protein F0267_13940 [Vibrio coralliilyticus]|nr:hypothetical protein [Vibrio coralliilyticus]ERB66325.1 hypothetical protein N779_05495 [Vibrio coralliilyticus OCN008]NOH39342.1 hypothetical protein [Vibrio coralliilyticus]QIJ87152.1 hypothetical protein G3U99_23250 [Vibrio coralliilyticus OCN008]
MKEKLKLALGCFLVVLTGCSNSNTVGETEPMLEKMAIGVKSTYGGTVQWPAGMIFFNAIGTTHDPKIGGRSWIAVWSAACANDENYRPQVSITGDPCPNGQNALGGHVVFEPPQDVDVGGTLYLAPICTWQNNDENLEMTVLSGPQSQGSSVCVVKLDNFMGN